MPRAMMPARSVLLLLALAFPSGCKDERASQAAQAASDLTPVATAAAQDLKATLPQTDALRFRGVQVYSQAAPRQFAVCGQVAPFADDAGLFVPFVSLVTEDGAGRYGFEHRVATNPAEASRMYIAMVARCFDKGGPVPGPAQGVARLPPLPDTVADPAQRVRPADVPALASPAPSPPVSAAASGTVTIRSNATVHADPKGASVRVAPAGAELHVFAQSPGGWLQVGDTAPWGWVHESMLLRR